MLDKQEVFNQLFLSKPEDRFIVPAPKKKRRNNAVPAVFAGAQGSCWPWCWAFHYQRNTTCPHSLCSMPRCLHLAPMGEQTVGTKIFTLAQLIFTSFSIKVLLFWNQKKYKNNNMTSSPASSKQQTKRKYENIHSHIHKHTWTCIHTQSHIHNQNFQHEEIL